jgi:hypothetical protein
MEWDLAQSDRESIRDASTSNRKVFDVEHIGYPSKETPIKILVHLETATVVFPESGANVTRSAPVKMKLTSSDSNGFTLSGSHCLGPHYLMETKTPNQMLLLCTIRAVRTGRNVLVSFAAYADGSVDDGRPKKVDLRP